MSCARHTISQTALALLLGASLLAPPLSAASDPKPSVELARGLIDAERFEQAVDILKRLDGSVPEDRIALLMGRIYLSLGKPAKATEFFEQASFASLDDGEAQLGLAEANLALGKLTKARSDATMALKADPDLVAAHLVLARVDQRLGKAGEAMARLRRLQQDRPESEDVAIILARYVAQQEGPSAAVSELEGFLGRYPSSAMAHDHLGQFLWSAGRKAEAVETRTLAAQLYSEQGQSGRADAMAAWLKAVDPAGRLKAQPAKAPKSELEARAEPDEPAPASPKTKEPKPEPPPPQAQPQPRPPVEAAPLPPARKVVQAAVLPRPEPLPFAPGTPIMTGSGIVLEGGRQIITNRHVIEGTREIAVRNGSGHVRTARVVKVSQEDDLALLEMDRPFPDGAALPLADIVEPAPGRAAIVMGYPLIGILGDEQPALTEGIVAKTAGLANDPTMFQLTAKLNKGNSGGPVFDRRGRLIGVAVGKMDTAEIMKKSGTLPEDMNFGIKAGRVVRFLGKPIGAEKTAAPEMSLEDLYQQMLPRAVLIAAQK